jgi:hypothetical protein
VTGWEDGRDLSALPPFADLLAGLADVDLDQLGDEDESEELAQTRAMAMDIERVGLVLPIELTVEPLTDGTVRLAGSTPTQYTETTVMPIFHRLTLHLTKNVDGEE